MCLIPVGMTDSLCFRKVNCGFMLGTFPGLVLVVRAPMVLVLIAPARQAKSVERQRADRLALVGSCWS